LHESRRFAPSLTVPLLYAGLAALLLYWPLLHLTTHVPGDAMTDYFHFHWSYWWTRHALVTPGLSVYETNFVLFPYTTNLAYHAYAPFWYPLWALIEPLAGTLVAVQAIYVVALTLTGWMMCLLLRAEGVPYSLALAGGALLQLSHAMTAAVFMTTLHYLGFFWLPLHILLWRNVVHSVKAGQGRRALLWALAQGVGFYLMLMTDYQYGVYALFLLGPYGTLTLIRAGTRRARLRLISLGLLALAITAPLLWWAGPLPHLLTFDRSQLVQAGPVVAHSLVFPEGLFWRFTSYRHEMGLGSLVLPATILSALAGVVFLRGRIRDRRRWFWLALAVPPLILAVGPSITVLGAQITMPYALLHELLGGLFRSVHRFGLIFMIPALVFIGRTWGPLLRIRRRSRPLLAAVIVLAVLVDGRLFRPMPIQPVMPPYDFYRTMGDERGPGYDEYVVVEVPVAAGTGEYFVGGEMLPMATQFYGMTHGKRMINGLIARAPVEHFFYLRTDDPMLSWLGQRRYLEPDAVVEQLRERVHDWPIGYIVVHQDLIGRESTTIVEIVGFFNRLADLLCPVFIEGDAIAYRSVSHPDGCPPRTPPEIEPGVYVIDLGAPDDVRFIGWGWHWPEEVAGLRARWTGDQVELVAGQTWDHESVPRAEVYVDLPPGDYQLRLNAQSFAAARALTVRVNGETVGVETIPAGDLVEAAFTLPAVLIGTGEHIEIALEYDPPGQADQRSLALMIERIEFRRAGP
jgi:hypothetical protein